jgi:hypothetical protein
MRLASDQPSNGVPRSFNENNQKSGFQISDPYGRLSIQEGEPDANWRKNEINRRNSNILWPAADLSSGAFVPEVIRLLRILAIDMRRAKRERTRHRPQAGCFFLRPTSADLRGTGASPLRAPSDAVLKWPSVNAHREPFRERPAGGTEVLALRRRGLPTSAAEAEN